jgi:hypothetical protein
MFSEPIPTFERYPRGRRLDPDATGFVADREAQEQRLDMLRNLCRDIIESNAGSAVGVELAFRAPDRMCYCAILEEPDRSGRGRIVYFDEGALHRHHVCGSPEEALERAIAQGYVERADGTMDRLATSQEWRRGSAYGDLARRYARGELDARQFDAEVRKLGC